MSNTKVEKYFERATLWEKEIKELRKIILETGLNEELKWGKPCYSYGNKNIVIIQDFKQYLAILFFKGALIKDPKGLLQKTGVNTVVSRQFRFTDIQSIKKYRKDIKQYVKDAIDVEKQGLKIKNTEKAKIKIPKELEDKLEINKELKKGWKKLTPGRQRAYIFFINSAKLSKTRLLRVEKYINKISQGKGIND